MAASPEFWPGRLLGLVAPDPRTLAPVARTLTPRVDDDPLEVAGDRLDERGTRSCGSGSPGVSARSRPSPGTTSRSTWSAPEGHPIPGLRRRAYRDLHPSSGGDNYIDLASVPFQLPLGALLPVRLRKVLPGCKNIGTTHITNGCYRLHPVEWNVGEVAGNLAAYGGTSGP